MILLLSICADPLGDMHRSSTQKRHPTLYACNDTNGIDVHVSFVGAQMKMQNPCLGSHLWPVANVACLLPSLPCTSLPVGEAEAPHRMCRSGTWRARALWTS